jgi:hypothetical protein
MVILLWAEKGKFKDILKIRLQCDKFKGKLVRFSLQKYFL